MSSIKIPNLEITNNDDDKLIINIKDADVCVVNALRRTILSKINTLVFRGFPYESNNINITENTTKFNNEYLKHRLSCIPIMENDETKYTTIKQNYKIMIDVENTTPEKIYVTTKDIQIVNKESGKVENDQIKNRFFPADSITGEYILLCILYPNYNSKNERNEKIKLEAEFDIGCADENNCWNVVHNCTYEFRRNEQEIEKQASNIKDELEKNDFKILNGQRIYFKNEYMFTVQSLGIYSNIDLVHKASKYILNRLHLINNYLTTGADTKQILTSDDILSSETDGTTSNEVLNELRNQYCKLYKEENNMYVFEIKDDDYTIGKMIEYYLYSMYNKELEFVGFKKIHPTKPEAYIYIRFKNNKEELNLYYYLIHVVNELAKIFGNIEKI